MRTNMEGAQSMGSRLRRRELIPEGASISASLSNVKLVNGQFGRQIEAKVTVIAGEYRGNFFPEWFSFSLDKDSNEEYVAAGSPLHEILKVADADCDDVL